MTIDRQQIYITIDAAIEGKVGLLRVYSVIYGVVYIHQKVVLVLQMLRDLSTEGRISAVMGGNGHAVENHLGRGVDTSEFQIDLFLSAELRLCKGLVILAGTTIIVITAVLAVQVIPGMGHIHLLGGG